MAEKRRTHSACSSAACGNAWRPHSVDCGLVSWIGSSADLGMDCGRQSVSRCSTSICATLRLYRNQPNTGVKVEIIDTKTVPDFNDPDITYDNLSAGTKRSKRLESCVLYIDIRDSASISAAKRPETLARMYSTFVRCMIPCARPEHHLSWERLRPALPVLIPQSSRAAGPSCGSL